MQLSLFEEGVYKTISNTIPVSLPCTGWKSVLLFSSDVTPPSQLESLLQGGVSQIDYHTADGEQNAWAVIL